MAATICWGLAAWINVALPQVIAPFPSPGKSVPAKPVGKHGPPPPPPVYKAGWSVPLNSVKQVRVAAGTANVFIGTDTGPLKARTLADATDVWTADLKPDVDLAAGDQLLFVAEGDVLHALEQDTGHERWRVTTGPLAVAPMWQVGWVFTAAKSGALTAFRAADGSQVWQQALGSPAAATMALDGDRLFVALADQRLVCLGIVTGTVTWALKLSAVGGEPLALGDRVYLGTADTNFYSVKQGAGDVEWTHRLIRAKVAGHPILDERHIYVATLDNRVLALSRGNGAIQWMQPLVSRPGEQLLLESGQLIVPLGSGEFTVLEPKEGKSVLPKPAVPAVPAVPVPAAPKAGEGTKLAAPLVLAGTTDAPQLLRVTIGPDALYTLTSFRRDK